MSTLRGSIIKDFLRVILLLSFFIIPCSYAAKKIVKQEVDPLLRRELNGVLNTAALLQQACITKNKTKVDSAIDSLKSRISQAKARIQGKEANKRNVRVVLDAVRSYLDLARSSRSEQRQRNLAQAFSQVVYLAQSFKVDPFKLYFCSKDRSVWIQKTGKPMNPISPEKFLNCGSPIQ